ncbi:MAG: eCIS core domain-containing protein, partial [Planctomycetota bacterium]
EYKPNSKKGQKILAHELQHVLDNRKTENRGRGHQGPESKGGGAEVHGYAAPHAAKFIGDPHKQRRATERERQIVRGHRGGSGTTLDRVEADMGDIEPLTPELRKRCERITTLAAARARGILSQTELQGDQQLFIDQIDVEFTVSSRESDQDAVMRLAAEICRTAFGRWRTVSGGGSFNNRD